ncbi:MAG: hypothetical protein ACEPOW_11705 [Bacteroidales bacterium]
MDNWIVFLIWVLVFIVFSVFGRKKARQKKNEGSLNRTNVGSNRDDLHHRESSREGKFGSYSHEEEKLDWEDVFDSGISEVFGGGSPKQSFNSMSESDSDHRQNKDISFSSGSSISDSANASIEDKLNELRAQNASRTKKRGDILKKSSESDDMKEDRSMLSNDLQRETDMQNIAVSDIKKWVLTKPQTAFLLSEIFNRRY